MKQMPSRIPIEIEPDGLQMHRLKDGQVLIIMSTVMKSGAAISDALDAVLGPSPAPANADCLVDLYDKQDEDVRRRMFATLAWSTNLAMGLLHPGPVATTAGNAASPSPQSLPSLPSSPAARKGTR